MAGRRWARPSESTPKELPTQKTASEAIRSSKPKMQKPRQSCSARITRISRSPAPGLKSPKSCIFLECEGDSHSAPSQLGTRDPGEKLRALAFVAAAAILAAAPAHAEDCGKNGEGFSAWLASFKEVAVKDGLSRRAVDAVLDGVSYDPTVKRRDGGAAMFGQHFRRFS